jgi:signal transduction histidine kinase
MTNHAPTRDRPVRVLLVDDDPDDHMITRDVIADIAGGGYTLDWVPEFDAALEAICRGEHDVYLVDYRLGAKTGLDLLAAMRQRDCPGPVILLTGLGGPEVDRAAEEAGASDFIEKAKLDPVTLERAIRYTLRQRAYEAELERKVAERTAALERANATLREADRRKDEFLATLAHELRNPLAPIRNALAIMDLSPGNRSGLEKAKGVMERQVRHLARLIDDLLDASRLTRNILHISPLPVDLAGPLGMAVEGCRAAATAAGVTLHTELSPGPVVVNGDQARLSQVFANLLSNAIKYTEAGGRVTLSAERSDHEVVVSVRDTGVGISADELPRVFDLFGPVDRADARTAGGLGVGLAVAKRVAEMHGGSVSVASEGAGQGSVFAVRLPLHRPNR